MGGKKKK